MNQTSQPKMPETKKREIAYKIRIGDLLRGNQIFEETEALNKRLLHIELGNKKIIRVNMIANVIDKFESESESKFATITLDDGSGQIRARVFGEDVNKFKELIQGDTIVIIGFIRSYNQELYILPEIIKKTDTRYLLIRKLEIEKQAPQSIMTKEQRSEIKAYREQVIELIRASERNEGIDKEQIITNIRNAKPNIITQEIQKLLEDGIIYEPRPGRVRYLG